MSTTAQLTEVTPARRASFKRILLATDFSEPSAQALGYATALASRYNSELFVLHAIEPESRGAVPMDPLPHELNRGWLAAEQQMTGFLRTVHSTPHVILQRGEVWDTLSVVMSAENIDLIILGSHGRKGLAKLALGSVAEQVLHRADCPVLTVGPHAKPTAIPAKLSAVLFATDFGAASLRSLPYAIRIAEDFSSHLFLLHMLESISATDIALSAYGPAVLGAEDLARWRSAKEKEIETRLKELIPSSHALARPPEIEVRTDLLPEGILASAKSHHADLIVMGANHTESPRLAAHFPWALTGEIIRSAECPVLTVTN